MSARVTVRWGLWSRRLREWYNPGTPELGYATREQAEKDLPLAKRDYPRGQWVVVEMPEDGSPPRVGTA
jgi:hypothetical protein